MTISDMNRWLLRRKCTDEPLFRGMDFDAIQSVKDPDTGLQMGLAPFQSVKDPDSRLQRILP
jgi:hypothetical protein